jgi:hypothetical protein
MRPETTRHEHVVCVLVCVFQDAETELGKGARFAASKMATTAKVWRRFMSFAQTSAIRHGGAQPRRCL